GRRARRVRVAGRYVDRRWGASVAGICGRTLGVGWRVTCTRAGLLSCCGLMLASGRTRSCSSRVLVAQGVAHACWTSTGTMQSVIVSGRGERVVRDCFLGTIGDRGATRTGMPPRREPGHQAPTQATVVAQFRDYHAEKFSGQGDPRIVDEWIQGLEFIFEVMECPDRYRVVCAQLQLTGNARLWWNAYWSMRPGEKAGCTWDMFKELVRDKYYPSYYRAEMERQFLALQQGTRTVDEYEREFTRLAAFAPDLVRTEAQRAQRFIDGLYPAVRHNIVGHGTQTYARA
ncbi:Unknown protein, partial [Striga hermonthica]